MGGESSFLFSSLDNKDVEILVDAMTEVKVPASEVIIRYGEEGNELYVVESGILECYKENSVDGEIKVVKTCLSGDVFGELALLYSTTRQANVRVAAAAAAGGDDKESSTTANGV